jgi:propanediol dehydratase small subunit
MEVEWHGEMATRPHDLVHEMMSKIMKECTLNDGLDDQVEEKDLRVQGKCTTIRFSFCRSKMSREVIDRV